MDFAVIAGVEMLIQLVAKIKLDSLHTVDFMAIFPRQTTYSLLH